MSGLKDLLPSKFILPMALMATVTFNSPIGFANDVPTQEAPAPKITFVEDGNQLRLQMANGTSYAVELTPRDHARRQIYNNMPESMQAEFQEKRRGILKSLAQALRFTKLGIGMGAIMGDKISWVASKMNILKPFKTPELKNFEGPMDWFLETESTAYEAKEAAPKMKISQRGNLLINKILQGMDYSMWERAPLIAHSNEYGLYASVGGMAEAGVRGKGGFGGQYGLGITVGVNKETKAFVFQIFQGVEVFKSTSIPFAAFLGGNMKLAMYVSENSPGREHLKTQGTSDYPLAIPVFKSDSPTSFSTGLSTGLFPPAPFDTLLTFKNHNSETVIVRMAVSPMTKGFLEFKSGIDGNKLFLQPINIAYQKVKSSVNGVGLCAQSHLN